MEGKIRRLTKRIDELESRERWEGEGQMVKGSSSESDEGNGRWKWDGREWWCRVEYKGSLNARLRRRVSRAVHVAVEQESKKWREGLVKLRDRIDWNLKAGLLWERQFEKILLKHGWEKIPNWECFFVHREKGLFLSVYVDDIKLAGKKQNLDPMWKVLN